ncbi:MAG: hypothetical protein LBP62_01545 [Clostridiales bacterium]|jgi:hypothetical protein|nr:hypothetical protein [Clostridiales bacterium]
MIAVKETVYKNFGKCVEMSNGALKTLITVDIGPRIIYYGTADGRNVFFEDLSREVKRNGAYFDKNFKKGETWYLYGGHRMWKSPEDDATYIPDNYPVEYEIKECREQNSRDKKTALFTQKIQENTGLRFRSEVTMFQNGALKVRHIMENTGENTVRAAIWGISVMKGGGFAAVPLNEPNTGFLPSNNFSFWPYDDHADKRMSFIPGYLILSHDENIEKPFKIGLMCKKKIAAYSNDGLTFVKKFGRQNGAEYPDGNCNFESYISGLIAEFEALSPIFSIEAGQSAEHTEEFFIFEKELPPDKESLDRFFGELN